MVPAGCGLIDGHHDHTRHRVAHADDGFGNLTCAVVRRAPSRPTDTELITWDLCEETCTWLPQATLAGARAQQWAEIKACRDVAIADPAIVVSGREWQVRSASLAAIRAQLDVAEAVGPTWSTIWTFADNSRDTVCAADLRAVLLAVGLRADAAHQRAQALRSRIDAAMSVAEISPITWPPGAP